jgi:hypothetical protein
MNLTHWFPAFMAVATIIANAAITYATVSRHESELKALREDVQSLLIKSAVLEEKLRDREA